MWQGNAGASYMCRDPYTVREKQMCNNARDTNKQGLLLGKNIAPGQHTLHIYISTHITGQCRRTLRGPCLGVACPQQQREVGTVLLVPCRSTVHSARRPIVCSAGRLERRRLCRSWGTPRADWPAGAPAAPRRGAPGPSRVMCVSFCTGVTWNEANGGCGDTYVMQGSMYGGVYVNIHAYTCTSWLLAKLNSM